MITYTKATPSDFLAAAALDRRAWVEYDNGENVPDGEHVWRIWAEHALMFVARNDLAVIGAIVAFPCISGTWYVHKLFVDRDWRKRGIGAELFRRLLAVIDDLGIETFLTVGPGNQKLIAFYQSLGFSQSEFFQGYYRATEDRWVLTRPAGCARTDPDARLRSS